MAGPASPPQGARGPSQPSQPCSRHPRQGGSRMYLSRLETTATCSRSRERGGSREASCAQPRSRAEGKGPQLFQATPVPALRMRLCIAQWGLGTCRGRQNPRRLPFTSRSACVRIPGQRSGAAWVMVQLRPRASRAPVSASAMVDEGQPASEEEAEHGLLLGQPSSGAAAEPLEEDEEGDDELDDEAPEELTFASAQAEAKEEERRVRETVRRDKTLLKEKRKRREELFIEQKKRKLLPDTILEKLTTASQTSVKKSPAKLKEVNLQKKNEECEKGSDSKKAKEKVQKVQTVGQNKSYLAVRLKDQDLRDSRQEAAKAFIQNCLYGPGTNRTTVNKFLSLDNKRLPVKKAAAQFLNNAWASQKKQNAKRFKRRWMVIKMKTSKK